MRVLILRSIGRHIDEFRERANIYVLFDVTWRKTGHDGRIVLINIFISNNFASNQKSLRLSTTSGSDVMAQTVVLMFLMTLTMTFGICHIDCHKSRHDCYDDNCKNNDNCKNDKCKKKILTTTVKKFFCSCFDNWKYLYSCRQSHTFRTTTTVKTTISHEI